MPILKGDVEILGLGNLLQLLAMNHREGVLTLTRESDRKTIHFAERGMRLLSSTMKRINKLGPAPRPSDLPRHLDAGAITQAVDAGWALIDARVADTVAHGLIPGALNIPVNRDFLTRGVPGVQGATAGAAFENPLARLSAVTGTAFVVAAVAGTFVLRRVVAARSLLAAWAVVGLTLIAVRTVVPVMHFCHEELWIAPLVCLSAGEAVAWLWSRGGWRSAAAVAAALAIAIEGSLLQWRAFTAQLH